MKEWFKDIPKEVKAVQKLSFSIWATLFLSETKEYV